MGMMMRSVGLTVAAFCLFSFAPAQARPTRFPAAERELMVPVQGGRVYVRVNGRIDGPKPPIVLIHGGPGGTHRGLLDPLELADERAVILYDQLDSGRSDRPNDRANWNVARFVAELEAVRAALGVKHWYVLGGSWGGTIALEYGAKRPQSIAGLVLASPLVSTRSWLVDAKALVARLPAATQADLKACDSAKPPAAPVCAAATGLFSKSFTGREARSAAYTAYQSPLDRGFNTKIYEAMWGKSEFVSTGSLKTYDGEPLLGKLDGRRTLFIVGQYDEARPITAIGFAERVAGAELAVVPGAAHSLFSDRPDETVAILRAWLRRQDAAGALQRPKP